MATAEDYKNRWKRPAVGPINPKADAIIFQQMDVENVLGKPMPGMPGVLPCNAPAVH